MPNLELAEGVRRVGFRKWYERVLLTSHAHMVLAFLSMIAIVASMEALRGAHGDTQLVNVLFVVICAAIGAWALRRYVFLLMRADLRADSFAATAAVIRDTSIPLSLPKSISEVTVANCSTPARSQSSTNCSHSIGRRVSRSWW